MLDYTKKFVKVLIWPIIFVIGQFLLLTVFTTGFINKEYNAIKLENPDVSEEQLQTIFNEYIETDTYIDKFETFVNDNSIFITCITFVIFGIIFYKKYYNYKQDYMEKLNIKTIGILIILGIILNLSYNLVIGSFNYAVHFTNNYSAINISILTYIICTGLLGPILEELLFRGIVFNKFKKFNPQMRAILLTTFIFTFFHSNFIQMLYAFCLGFILIYVYEKYKNIKAPIIVHMASNIMNIFTCMIIMKENYILNLVLMLISFLILFIINRKIIKKDLNTN